MVYFTHTRYQQFSKREELWKEFNVNNITLTLPFANVGIITHFWIFDTRARCQHSAEPYLGAMS